MLSLIEKWRKHQKRAKPGTGLKVHLRSRVEEQIRRGVPRQAIYDELMRKSRAVLVDSTASTPHADANAYMSVADQVLHVMHQRNRRAQACEKAGQVRQAIALYEANVVDGFEGARPYERLRLIYARQRRYADAIRVCQAYLALPDREHGQDKEAFRRHLRALQAKIP